MPHLNNNSNFESIQSSGGSQDVFYSPVGICPRPTIVKGEGIYLWDEQGKKYIDASSGPVTCSLGHSNKKILDAINQQSKELTFSFPSTARNLPNIRLAETLTSMAGDGFERALFVSGGSEAIDMAIKFCRQYRYAKGENSRHKLISCLPSYHGMNLGTLAVSGDPIFSDIFGDMITMGEKIPAMLDYHDNHLLGDDVLSEEEFALKCAGHLEEKIIAMGAETVLAFIIEPVGGSSSGAIAPPESYFNEIRRICDKYGVFLIYDEVMSGVGRSGEFLTSHLWPNARPDITVVAKGLGAGYVSVGAMLAPALLVDELVELTGFNYAYTYNASPLACAVGYAVLNEILENNLLKNTQLMGNYLLHNLKALQQKSIIIGDIRGRGLLIGIEFVACKKTRKPLPLEIDAVDQIRLIAQNHGLMLYGRRSNKGIFGENILLAPPLNVTQQEINKIMYIFTKVVTDFEDILVEKDIIK